MRRDVSEMVCEVSSDEMTDTYGVTHTHTHRFGFTAVLLSCNTLHAFSS